MQFINVKSYQPWNLGTGHSFHITAQLSINADKLSAFIDNWADAHVTNSDPITLVASALHEQHTVVLSKLNPSLDSTQGSPFHECQEQSIAPDIHPVDHQWILEGSKVDIYSGQGYTAVFNVKRFLD